MIVIVQKRKCQSKQTPYNIFDIIPFLICPGLAPTFISDGAVGIANVLIMRQHILCAQDKHTQHGWTVVTAGSATSNTCESQYSALWSRTEMDHWGCVGILNKSPKNQFHSKTRK